MFSNQVLPAGCFVLWAPSCSSAGTPNFRTSLPSWSPTSSSCREVLETSRADPCAFKHLHPPPPPHRDQHLSSFKQQEGGGTCVETWRVLRATRSLKPPCLTSDPVHVGGHGGRNLPVLGSTCSGSRSGATAGKWRIDRYEADGALKRQEQLVSTRTRRAHLSTSSWDVLTRNEHARHGDPRKQTLI